MRSLGACPPPIRPARLRDGRHQPSARDAGGAALPARPAATPSTPRSRAAAVLCVVEPMSTGVGGDAFALVWRDGELTGLNASGRAPAAADPDALGDAMPLHGPLSVTVPGAVAGWAALLERHGRSGLDRCLADAIDAAERRLRGDAGDRRRLEPRARRPGRFDEARPRVPAGAAVGRDRAATRARRDAAADRRRGRRTASTAARSRRRSAPPRWLDASTTSRRMRADWVEPLRTPLPRRRRSASCRRTARAPRRCRRSASLATLDLGGAWRRRSRAPAGRGDEARVRRRRPLHRRRAAAGAATWTTPYLAARRALIDPARAGDPAPGALPRGGTVYLCVVDARPDAPARSSRASTTASARASSRRGTGIELQNRGACFTLEPGHPNRLAPGKRPFHTIIPGMLLATAALLGPFGVMGGHVQPQGHLQFVSNLLDRGLDPQAALDAPRWRLDQRRATAGCCAWSRASGTSPTSSSGAATASGAIPTRPASAAARRSSCAATGWSAAPSRARTASPPATDARTGSRPCSRGRARPSSPSSEPGARRRRARPWPRIVNRSGSSVGSSVIALVAHRQHQRAVAPLDDEGRRRTPPSGSGRAAARRRPGSGAGGAGWGRGRARCGGDGLVEQVERQRARRRPCRSAARSRRRRPSATAAKRVMKPCRPPAWPTYRSSPWRRPVQAEALRLVPVVVGDDPRPQHLVARRAREHVVVLGAEPERAPAREVVDARPEAAVGLEQARRVAASRGGRSSE